MKKPPPPFKLAVAALFLDEKARGAAEVLKDLAPAYQAAKIFTPGNVELALQSLKAVGILRLAEGGAAGTLYALTEHGRDKVRKSL